MKLNPTTLDEEKRLSIQSATRSFSTKLFLSACLLPTVAPAATARAPQPLAGTYSMTGEVQPVVRIHRVQAFAPNPEGRERIEELRALGYRCTLTVRTHVCMKRFIGEIVPENAKAKMLKQESLRGDVTFDTLRGEPTLVIDGEIAKEWDFDQMVQVGSASYATHRRLVSQGVEKIKLGDASLGNGTEFTVGPDTLFTTVSATIAVDQKGFETNEYVAQVVRERLP